MGASEGGALAGRRVLELADERGVYCGRLLADMGADVIKIERPGGDPTRRLPPLLRGGGRGDRSLFFLYTNTSKRGVTLDLTRPEGQALFRRLAATADLVIETLPPGFLDERGIGYPALREASPRLVLTSITGFGQTGPARGYRSSDLVACALGGAMVVTGDPEDPPVRLCGSQAHVVASLCAASASLIALWHVSRGGEGQHADISAQEAVVSLTHICGVGKWLEDGIVPRRAGASLFASVPSGVFPCRDGGIYLMVNRPLHWKALARWIHEETGVEEVLDPLFEGPSSRRLPYRELVDLWVSDLTARFAVEELYREGQRRHLAVTPIRNAAGVAGDPQLAARGFFVDLPDPEGGVLRAPGAPYRHAETPWRIRGPAPAVGQHNEDVYCGELGLAREELAALARAGVV